MKLKKKWLIGICLGLMVSFAQAATQEEQLKLAKSYNKQFIQYYQQGKFKKALPLAEKAFKIRESLLGEKDPDTLISLNNLAFIYQASGRLNEALPLLEQGYRLRKQVLGAKHPQTLASLNNLAYTYAKIGHIDKAIKHFEQSFKGVEALRKAGDLSVETRQALFKKWIHGYFMLSKLYLIKAHPNDAFQIAEMTKARTLLESMTAKLAAQKAGLSTT